MAAIEQWLKYSAAATATMNRDRQELKVANKQFAEWDAEINQLRDLLNQLQARRKKSGANLADIEAVLEILENH